MARWNLWRGECWDRIREQQDCQFLFLSNGLSYINAEEILTEELIRQIQEYSDGTNILSPVNRGPAFMGTGNRL